MVKKKSSIGRKFKGMRKSAADATSSTSCTASTSRKATKRKSDDVTRDDEAIEGEQINKLEKELSMCKK